MRAEQPSNIDPYRTLGLEPGASMAEVKRAYRLLAKAFHPDSAGEAALPRFLAIHEAYEQLRSGRPPSISRASRATPAGSTEPWKADPARARAARERARSARARPSSAGSGTSSTSARTSSTSAGTSSTSAGSSRASGSSEARGPSAAGSADKAGASNGTGSGEPRTQGGRTSRRATRKATMGSTSYDEARDHGDATWSGASWYGPSTGEYWIVNPREYADPRKHGPEYQSRARRPLDGRASEELEPQPIATESVPSGTSTSTRTTARPTTTGAGWAPPDPPQSDEVAPSSTRARSDASAAAPGTPQKLEPGERAAAADPLSAVEAASRAWLGAPADDPVRRLGLALVAWPPIGLAAAAVIGDVTGCSVYSASCGDSEPLLPWLAQAVILGLLLLLPPLTRILAGGTIAVLLALVPITALLVAVGGTGAPQAAFVLTALLGAAWLAGVGWAARVSVRRATMSRAGP